MASPHRRQTRSRSNSTGAVAALNMSLNTQQLLETASSRLQQEALDPEERPPVSASKSTSEDSSLATTPTTSGKPTFGPKGDTLKTLETFASLSKTTKGATEGIKPRIRSKSDPNIKETKANVTYVKTLETWEEGRELCESPRGSPSEEPQGSSLRDCHGGMGRVHAVRGGRGERRNSGMRRAREGSLACQRGMAACIYQQASGETDWGLLVLGARGRMRQFCALEKEKGPRIKCCCVVLARHRRRSRQGVDCGHGSQSDGKANAGHP
eukprot:TRINITY_DN10622_c0_g1_i2.p1 TRINITY_DN10622_c0_g1~~TRINITY_DN10622_c0_g1_i2.p1  ORF type:complete len:268 (+),score=22.28 TRINITY_DN10622_c0_g1_i2:68-871(+)